MTRDNATRIALLRVGAQNAARIQQAIDDDHIRVVELRNDLEQVGAPLAKVERALDLGDATATDPQHRAAAQQTATMRVAYEAATNSITTCLDGLDRTSTTLRPLVEELTQQADAQPDPRHGATASIGMNLASAHARILSATLQTEYAQQAADAVDTASSEGAQRLTRTTQVACSAPSPAGGARPPDR